MSSDIIPSFFQQPTGSNLFGYYALVNIFPFLSSTTTSDDYLSVIEDCTRRNKRKLVGGTGEKLGDYHESSSPVIKRFCSQKGLKVFPLRDKCGAEIRSHARLLDAATEQSVDKLIIIGKPNSEPSTDGKAISVDLSKKEIYNSSDTGPVELSVENLKNLAFIIFDVLAVSRAT